MSERYRTIVKARNGQIGGIYINIPREALQAAEWDDSIKNKNEFYVYQPTLGQLFISQKIYTNLKKAAVLLPDTTKANYFQTYAKYRVSIGRLLNAKVGTKINIRVRPETDEKIWIWAD